LKDQIQTLHKELAEMATSSVEADRMRQQASNIFNSNDKSMETEMHAVRTALKVLKEQFAKPSKGAATALIEERTGSYTQDATRIITLLEVVEEDIIKARASAKADEAASKRAYEKIKQENKDAKLQKEQDLKLKTRGATSLEKALTEHSSDLDSVQSELASVLEYSKNIDAMCSSGHDKYAIRQARRDAEIEGLREALRMLDGETVLLQSNPHRLRTILIFRKRCACVF
jgi:hypothetical protein